MAAGPRTARAGSSRRFVLFALASAGFTNSAGAEPLRVTLATATPGGGFPAFGDAFAAAVPSADPGIAIETRPSGGSAENLMLLRRGEVDLALVQGAYAYPALAQSDGLTVLAPMYATPGLFVVRADSPVRSVDDLRGRPVALGTHASGLTVMGRAVLAASGLDPDRDIRPILLDHAGDGPAMVLDGRAAALWGGGLGWPGFLAVASAPGGARFLGPSKETIAVLAARDTALAPLIVPEHAFPGQDQPIETIGSWSLVVARPGFPPEAAFRIVRALDHAQAQMRAHHPQGGESDPHRLTGIVPASAINRGTAQYLAAGDERR